MLHFEADKEKLKYRENTEFCLNGSVVTLSSDYTMAHVHSSY